MKETKQEIGAIDSTEKINTMNASRAAITKVTTVLFVVLVIDTDEDAEVSTGSAYLYG
jgi:hypothetical protein